MNSIGFRLGGIDVQVQPIFFVLAVVLALGHTSAVSIALFVAIAFAAVLWHELAHAVAFRTFGYDSHIVLTAFGGLTVPATDRPLPPRRDLVVSLAGPVAGIAVGVLVLALADPELSANGADVLETALADVVWVSLGWGILNLAPILPLDGGRAMASVLDLATGGRGARPARYVSIVVGVALGVLALLNGLVFGLLMIGFLVYANVQELRTLVPPPPPDELARRLEEGWQHLSGRALLAASNRAREVLRFAGAPQLRISAADLLAWSLLLEGKSQQGSQLLDSYRPDPARAIVHPAAVTAAGGETAALELLRGAFRATPGDRNAARLAVALVERGRSDEAVRLVQGPLFEEAGSEPAAAAALALFRAGRFEEAARVGENGFDRSSNPTLAYNVACSWARAGDADAAVGWLHRAVAAGYQDLTQLDAETDFASIRGLPGFAEVRARLLPGEPERSPG